MRTKYKRLTIVVLSIYLLLSAYATYRLFKNLSQHDVQKKNTSWLRPAMIQKKPVLPNQHEWDFSLDDRVHNILSDTGTTSIRYEVEVWGKAAISMYLWEHILEADVVQKMGGLWSYGVTQINDIQFRYRTGPGVVPDKVPKDVKNLVLVLNGREESKIAFAEQWLDYLPSLAMLQHVAVMLLGNEQCDNDWIKPYLSVNGGRVEFVFIIYDSLDVDDYNFYQWPLGVATYRNFPCVDVSSVNTQKKRYFHCNFMGTVYANSSRMVLLQVLQDPLLAESCYIKPRMEWWPLETPESQADYIHALLQSDYTLSPVGINAESYRIYEAMSYGSIPILEDNNTPGRCRSTPYTLLKQYHAPVLFVKHWTELKNTLRNNTKFSMHENIVKHRQNVLEWYKHFKWKMKEKFVNVISQRFFNTS